MQLQQDIQSQAERSRCPFAQLYMYVYTKGAWLIAAAKQTMQVYHGRSALAILLALLRKQTLSEVERSQRAEWAGRRACEVLQPRGRNMKELYPCIPSEVNLRST